MIISKGNKQPFPELRGKLEAIRYPAYVEPKIDGELNWYIPCGIDYPNSYFVNKSGKQRACMPALAELGPNIKHKLLGELHWGEGKSGDLYEFLKHQDDDELHFTVFDVDMPGTYEERMKWLLSNIKPSPHVWLNTGCKANTKEGVETLYKMAINVGWEGVVVKSADSRLIMGPCPWVKMKHRETIEAEVREVSATQERIEIAWAIKIGNMTKQMKNVGVKVPVKIRQTLKPGDMVEIEHQGILSQGGLRHPVYIRKVGEK